MVTNDNNEDNSTEIQVSPSRKRPRLSPPPPNSTSNHRQTDNATGQQSAEQRNFPSQEQSKHPDNPEWNHYGQLILCLFLTVGLSVLSALDAERQCRQEEDSAVSQLVDDDAAVDEQVTRLYDSEYYHECRAVVRQIVMPSGFGTIALCACAYIVVLIAERSSPHEHLRDGLMRTTARPRMMPYTAVSNWLATLLVLVFFVWGLQLWWIATIMIMPRILHKSSSNPYASLAAVDRYGHVGANANLYYLTWMSIGLATALVYQILTAWVRTQRRVRQQQLVNAQATDGFLPLDGTSSTVLIVESSSSSRSSSNSSISSSSMISEGSAAAAVALSKTWLLQAAARPRETWKRLSKARKANDEAHWYNSLYKLRFRTGIWAAALIASWLVAASSQYVATHVLWPVYSSATTEWAQKQGQAADSNGGSLYPSWHVCRVIQKHQEEQHRSYSSVYYQSSQTNSSGIAVNFTLPPQFCQRTVVAWIAGILSTVLCATAIGLHLTAKRFRREQLSQHHDSGNSQLQHHADSDFFLITTWYSTTSTPAERRGGSSWRDMHGLHSWNRIVAHHPRLPLRTELLLSLLLSVLTGANAFVCTGVQGPAATVGNLYYATWMSFLFCVRVALGCLEEFYNLEDDHLQEDVLRGNRSPNNNSNRSLDSKEVHLAGTSTSQSNTTVSKWLKTRDPMERNRLGDVRSYFFLGLFSLICAFSAYDAASNQQSKNQKYKLSREQLYMMISPVIVSVQSLLLFALCLSRRCYVKVAKVGGFCAFISFCLWLGNLVLTMHSEDSWAVNAVGEIEMANLYYFSWSSMITAGLQMSWHVKQVLGLKMRDFMSVVWLAIVKVCFVILGASLHIWHSISDNCEFEEITSGAVTFCSRTVLAIVVALTGMLVGSIIVLIRLILLRYPRSGCRRVQSHIEMCISLFLVLLFGAAVALITGIGGPGQTVGDLYYSAWLSFWVSLGLFVNCWSSVLNDGLES